MRRLLRREDLPKLFGGDTFTKHTIRYAWHLLTIFCAAFAFILFWFALLPLEFGHWAVLMVFAVTFLFCAGWGIVATGGKHFSWVVFLVAVVATWIGAGLGVADHIV